MPSRVEPTGRRAFTCPHKDCNPPNNVPLRIFLEQGVTDVPRCPKHGAMERQVNQRYGGRRGGPVTN